MSTACPTNQKPDTEFALAMRLLRTVLFAAGASHFIGNGSVIDLLRQRGIRVTRIR